jgi:hypothetical protein
MAPSSHLSHLIPQTRNSPTLFFSDRKFTWHTADLKTIKKSRICARAGRDKHSDSRGRPLSCISAFKLADQRLPICRPPPTHGGGGRLFQGRHDITQPDGNSCCFSSQVSAWGLVTPAVRSQSSLKCSYLLSNYVPWFLINWIKTASRWFHCTDILWCTVNRKNYKRYSFERHADREWEHCNLVSILNGVQIVTCTRLSHSNCRSVSQPRFHETSLRIPRETEE